MKSNQYFSTASSCGQPHKPIKSLVVCNLEHGQKLLQFSLRGELSCCCYAVIWQSTSRQQAVNKQSKGNQYNDYLRKYSRVLLDFPGLTKAVTYDERPKNEERCPTESSFSPFIARYGFNSLFFQKTLKLWQKRLECSKY